MSYLNLSKLALVAVLIGSWTAGPAGLAGTGAAASAHAIAAHAQPPALRGAPHSGIPQQELPCSGLPNVQGPATWWNESQSPTQWEEFTGYYTVSQTNQGTFYEPCGIQASITCPPSPACPGNIGNDHSQIEPMKTYTGCTRCYVVAEFAGASLAIYNLKPKGKPILKATLSSEGYLPVGLAVAEDDTIFASAISANPSGGSLVLAYAKGATNPTATFADPAVGENAAAIAVDSKDDLFLSFPVIAGSQTNLQIDEFPKGSGKPHPFASVVCAQPGGMTVTEKGNVIVACAEIGRASCRERVSCCV
jgi:hypothetical protein